MNESCQGKHVKILWHLVRPSWPLLLLAFGANLFAALFEGSTIGFLVAALQVLGSTPAGFLAVFPGSLGEGLNRLYQLWGRDFLFLGLALGAVIAQILRSLLQFAGEAVTAHLQARVEADLYHRIFSRIMHLPFSKVSAYRLGDLTDYLGRAGHLHELISYLNIILRAVLLLVTSVILLLWLSVPLTLAVLVAYGLVATCLRWIVETVGRYAQRLTQVTVAISGRTTELLQGIRLIHTFARQEETIGKVDRWMKEGLRNRRQATLWGSTVEPVIEILTVVGSGLFLVGGYLLLGTQRLATLPSLLAFLLALQRMTPRLGLLYNYLVAFAHLAPGLGRVSEILSQAEDPVQTDGGRPFERLKEGIEFQEVTFQYLPEEAPAVLNLSFQIPRGSLTALVGASGAGKSTVVDLLLGLFAPTSGRIRVDGIDSRDLNRTSWRNRLGVVAQEPFLFHASIRENIAFGKPDATLQEIVAAAQVAHAEEFILRLGEGYETVVGDRGFRLSGGQRQRIALARALIRQPEILILDEATSALDSESERWIQAAMGEQRGRRTVLAIAHRLSTVARADQILVLAQGILTEQGTHQELLNRNGLYAHLWRLQSEEHRENAPLLLKEVAG